METNNKQSVTGLKVLNFQVKKTKDTEKIKLVLEADIENISAGEYDMGDILKALLSHQAGDVDIGLSVFIEK